MPARIYKPSRNAMQSGKGKSDFWVLEHEQETKTCGRPADGLDLHRRHRHAGEAQVRHVAEEAEAYARRKGIAYVVQAEAPVRLQKKSYSDNFKFGRTENWTH
jgi:hypothetical protein